MRPVLITLACAAALILTRALPAQDLGGLVDQAAAYLWEHQNADGSYGLEAGALTTTSLVLQALAGCHRQYRDSDGPFMRRASRMLARRLGPDGGATEVPAGERLEATAWIVLGLAASGPDRHAPLLRAARDFLSLQETPETPRLGYLLWRAGAASAGIPPAAPRSVPEAAWRIGTRVGAEAPDDASHTVLHAALERLSGSSEGLGIEPLDLVPFALAAAGVPALETSDGTPWHAALVALLLKRQRPDGHFDLGEEPTRDTAIAILGLTAAQRATKKTTAGPAAPEAPTPAVPHSIAIPPDLRDRYEKGARAALEFLASEQQEGQFGFGPYKDPGITSLVLAAVIVTSRNLGTAEPPWVKQGLDYLASLAKEDGSIYLQGLKVYVTSAAVMALVESGREEYRPLIARARDYLVQVQSDEGEGYSSAEDWGYGGIGYGSSLRPDLSNTQFGLEALQLAGTPPEHAAFQRALLFLQRCQNDEEGGGGMVIEQEIGTVVPGRDGGATYAPGSSKAGYIDLGDGRFIARSYGSMTYALLKSYIFAGLEKDDPRVQAAYEWVRKNYTLQENPGFDSSTTPDAGFQGLYYYYYTMAKALDAYQVETVADSSGIQHRWRQELATHLLALQGDSGAWRNDRSERWLEGNPVLATAYALVTLGYCF
ncbi:MAG: prenyltransferase/squalene oxidase repeat-containing protein [Planctomycetota bacterium]